MRTILFFLLLILVVPLVAQPRFNVIEDFDSLGVVLTSYSTLDSLANNYVITDTMLVADSLYCLFLKGKNAKQEAIQPITVDHKTVWQISTYAMTTRRLQAFGVADSAHVLFYSFYGTDEVDPATVASVYQGSRPKQIWTDFKMPIGEDWYSRYDYYPTITNIIYLNNGNGKVLFDHVIDITSDLIGPPMVSFTTSRQPIQNKKDHTRNLTVAFTSTVVYADSTDTLSYYWQFGDSLSSTEANPTHEYTITDDHPYSVVLTVRTQSGLWGYATGQLAIEEGDSSLPITLNFVGDTMFARGVQNLLANNNWGAVFDSTRARLSAADLTIANFECCLTDAQEHHPTKPIFFKGNPENAAALPYSGIDIVSMANNHVYDYLNQGLIDTKQALDDNHILHAGAGINSYEANRPLIVTEKGKALSFLMSTDRTGQYNNYQPFIQAGYDKPGPAFLSPYFLDQQLSEATPLSNFQIVQMHAGSEYSLEPGANYDKGIMNEPIDESEDEDAAPRADYPPLWDINLRHHAIDSGADIVIVHHSHVIQGFEMYQNKLIAHSLGNFVFDIDRIDCMPSMILEAKLNEDHFYSYKAYPVFIYNDVPIILRDKPAQRLFDYLTYRSRALNTWFIANPDSGFGFVVTDTTQYETDNHIAQSIPLLQTIADTTYTYPIEMEHTGYLSSFSLDQPIENWSYRVGTSDIWFGDMEEATMPSLWTLQNNYSEIVSDTYYQGHHSMHLKTTNTHQSTYFDYSLPSRLVTTGICSVTGFIKAVGIDSASVTAFYIKGTNTALSNQVLPIQLSQQSTWQPLSFNLNVPNETTRIRIRITVHNGGIAEGNAWVDNLDLIEWTNWKPANQNQLLTPNGYQYLQFRSVGDTLNPVVTYTEKTFRHIVVPNVDTTINAANLKLFPNYPNPFNPRTNISFELKRADNVSVTVYNIKGQRVVTLLKNHLEPGRHTVTWEGKNIAGRNVATGVYFYRIETGKEKQTRKMLLLK